MKHQAWWTILSPIGLKNLFHQQGITTSKVNFACVLEIPKPGVCVSFRL